MFIAGDLIYSIYQLADDTAFNHVFKRQLVLDIVSAGNKAVSIPIFVKIRLLDTIEETIKLCHQLRDAGASLIAIHARCEYIYVLLVCTWLIRGIIITACLISR